MKRRAKLQRLYQIFPLRTLDTTKKRGVTLLYTMFEGGFIFARNTAGESPASFGTDWTVKSARPSEVRKRRPYPVVGFPASSVKIVVGMSTAALVSGTAYLCQAIGSADAGIGESEAPAVASSGVASEEACTPAVTLPLLCGVVIELVISDAAFHCSVGRLSGPVGAAASRAVTSALEGCSADAIVSRADVSSRSSASARFSLSSSACLNSFCLASAICLVSSARAAFSRSRTAMRLRAATSLSRADASSRASASDFAWLLSSACFKSLRLEFAIRLLSKASVGATSSRSRAAVRRPIATDARSRSRENPRSRLAAELSELESLDPIQKTNPPMQKIAVTKARIKRVRGRFCGCSVSSSGRGAARAARNSERSRSVGPAKSSETRVQCVGEIRTGVPSGCTHPLAS